ncbi:MAG: type II 3-dehydroquinate dehydratase [Paludibacteraceae bacterium]|nr:type II 3-dehydroquinate dehydratase [Paludibacteraceae bacterium]
MKIAIINGPNLNMLGKREPQIYGTRTFDDYLDELRHRYDNIRFVYFQSNHEGDLIDKVQEYGEDCEGIVINAGGYTHTSIALRDAIAATNAKVVEVHISDIYAREEFRHHSFLKDVCQASYVGYGLKGYDMAIDKIISLT